MSRSLCRMCFWTFFILMTSPHSDQLFQDHPVYSRDVCAYREWPIDVDSVRIYICTRRPNLYPAYSIGTPCIIPGNTGVHDLVTLGRVIWVIDTIRTLGSTCARTRSLTRADRCTGSWERSNSRMWGRKRLCHSPAFAAFRD